MILGRHRLWHAGTQLPLYCLAAVDGERVDVGTLTASRVHFDNVVAFSFRRARLGPAGTGGGGPARGTTAHAMLARGQPSVGGRPTRRGGFGSRSRAEPSPGACAGERGGCCCPTGTGRRAPLATGRRPRSAQRDATSRGAGSRADTWRKEDIAFAMALEVWRGTCSRQPAPGHGPAPGWACRVAAWKVHSILTSCLPIVFEYNRSEAHPVITQQHLVLCLPPFGGNMIFASGLGQGGGRPWGPALPDFRFRRASHLLGGSIRDRQATVAAVRCQYLPIVASRGLCSTPGLISCTPALEP
ncbi:hypothetical protein GGR56DRAFT_253157 [Xylariaceae sp. FL0804]|nr:hypothetical protein GGR56DRAFT_253157 [Xylariaceae sp. FL0804]